MMECQDVRQLLAFHERPRDVLDADERDAIQKHLDGCPECASLAQSDRAADQAIGAALRDVSVPAGLKSQVLRRLAAERGGVPWKRWAIAAAAAVLLATTAGVAWNVWPKPELVLPDRLAWERDDAQRYLADNGIMVSLPRDLEYNFLRQVDVLSVEGRPVARLKFVRDPFATVDIYIVDTRQFDVAKYKSNPSVVPMVTEEQSAYFCFYLGPNADAWLKRQTHLQ